MAKRSIKMQVGSIQREELHNSVQAQFYEQTSASNMPQPGLVGGAHVNVNVAGLDDSDKSRDVIKAALQAAIDAL